MTPNTSPPGAFGGPPAGQQSWFGRNWGWVLVLAVVLPVTCCGGFGLLTWFTAKKAVQSSAVYLDVMARVAMDSRVSEALGEPVEPGVPTRAEVSERNGLGTAELVIPFTGETSTGTLYVRGTGREGHWEYQQLEMVLASGTRIDLANPPPDEAPPAPRTAPAPQPPPGPTAPATEPVPVAPEEEAAVLSEEDQRAAEARRLEDERQAEEDRRIQEDLRMEEDRRAEEQRNADAPRDADEAPPPTPAPPAGPPPAPEAPPEPVIEPPHPEGEQALPGPGD